MDTQRVLLFVALSLILMLLWTEWGRFNAPPVPQAAISQQSVQGSDALPAVPGAVPQLQTPSAAPSLGSGLARGERVQVETDLLSVEIDTQGGDLRRAALVGIGRSNEERDVPFELLTDVGAQLFVAQTGLVGANGSANVDHRQVFEAAANRYVLKEGENELRVPLVWVGDGLRVTKTYVFHRDSYRVGVEVNVENRSDKPWQGALYGQLQRTDPGQQSMFLYTYTGAVVSTPDAPYEKVDFDDITSGWSGVTTADGWAAMIQHYFLAAVLPGVGSAHRIYSLAPAPGRYVIGVAGDSQSIAAGQSGALRTEFFVGPKIQERLIDAAPGLERTVDFGYLWFIAEPLHWLLKQLHSFVGNWGVAIILLTIMIKLVFYKLSETSYRSMAQMRKLGPRLQTLKERYGDDRQKLNEAMMKMYREEKVNPMSGCLPILVQIPVFIALYWALLESVELRHAPFFGWINDLSTLDPYFVLPILMGITMVIQQRLNPAPLDPIQQKLMMILPLVFTVFFAFFPSGLVLYWLVNNLLSITQQWVITKRIAG